MMPDLDRRSMLQHALLLVGAAAAAGAPEALAAAAKSPKHQLDAAQFRLLTAVSDTIIPKTDTAGALDVGVPKLVDALLGTWASPERRAQLLGALDTIDALARQQKGKPFAELSPADRIAVLGPHDIAALKAPPKPADTPPTSRAKQKPSESVMERFAPKFTDPGYGKLKELIVVGYYCSEAALTTELHYEHNPGVWEPSLPITPDTRPWGGNALV